MEKEIKGTILSIWDEGKLKSMIHGEEHRPRQMLKVLLESISEEEFTKLILTSKIKITTLDD